MDQVILETLKASPFALLFYWLLNYVLKTSAAREERLISVTERLTDKIDVLGNNVTRLDLKVDQIIEDIKKE